MSKCGWCEREKSSGVSCTETTVEYPDGLILPAIPYGSEAEDWGAASGNHCRDCLTPPGGYHHPGCGVERCPRCGGQLIGCGCLEEPEGLEA